MLTLLVGKDWVAIRDTIFRRIAEDISAGKSNRILIVPEFTSHDAERRLCMYVGDTSSRFAEVLSFSLLAKRVAEWCGFAAQECMDNGGRVVAMASATRQLHSVLKAYASVETRPEFLTGLVDMVDEFKRCCICSEDLLRASERAEGSFAQKLSELSLILESYDALCQRGKRDPRDQMTWALEQLKDSSFAEDHVFYIDGFPDFTRQHMAILEHLIQMSAHVVVGLNCDRPHTKAMAFEKSGETAAELLRIAEHLGVERKVEYVSERSSSLNIVKDKLFQGNIDINHRVNSLSVYQTESVYQECVATAKRIKKLVFSGSRYRDIAVVCTDMNVYKNTIKMIFGRSGIPGYISGTEDLLENPVIITVISALEAALNGFEQKDVLRYLRSALSPLELSVCDRLENYVIMWSINGQRWLSDWTNNPRGLGEILTEEDKEILSDLNSARKTALEPLQRLQQRFKKSINLKDQVIALYKYFDEIALSSRLDAIAEEFDTQGDNRNAQIQGQLWEILVNALEQLYDVLGNTAWDAETFTRLLKLLLSQYDVGTIPPVLDAVTIGPISAMRCQEAKHLFVLGALEGCLPSYGSSAGVLTDQERTALRKLGVPLTGGAMEGIQAEFADIYGVFCGAADSLTVSCPAGQPSFLFRRLSSMAANMFSSNEPEGFFALDKYSVGAYLARENNKAAAVNLDITDIYEDLLEKKEYNLGKITECNIKKLYGCHLRLSASQVDKLADCRLSYFLKYGLRVKERKPITIDPAEFGTYVHSVLENTAKEIITRGGFRVVSLEETLSIASKFSSEYAKLRFSELDTNRLLHLFKRNEQELSMIVSELWQELHFSEFVPADFELQFGDDGKLPAIPINGMHITAQLSGFVDRVDTWTHNDKVYYRVIDYKTGKKDFDYCDVFNGLGLQMLLYLFALEHGGTDFLGEAPIPAGVQYFPARAPVVSADGWLNDEDATAAREKTWKRKGLLLNDDSVLYAMDSSDPPIRLPITRRKDGNLVGDIADSKQLNALKTYIFKVLGKMVDEIASGAVAPNPYTRGSNHNACTFCPYSEICHQETVEGRRNFKAITAQRFWEDIEKELRVNG